MDSPVCDPRSDVYSYTQCLVAKKNQYRLDNRAQCQKTALFFHDVSGPAMTLIFFACVAVAIGMTVIIRNNTPRDSKSPPAKTDFESPLPESVTGDEELPPPYETPAPASEKRSSAHLFVIGTCAIVPALTATFLLALAIQHAIFCQPDVLPATPVPFRVFLWLLYVCLCAWVSVGVGCWLILFRDLRGPAAAKKYPINESIVGILIIGIMVAPFALVWYSLLLFKKGLVKGVEMCQERCCGDALETGEREGTELEEGVALMNGVGSATRDMGHAAPPLHDKPTML